MHCVQGGYPEWLKADLVLFLLGKNGIQMSAYL